MARSKNEVEILIRARDEASKALEEINKKLRNLEGTAIGSGKSLAGMEQASGGMGRRILEMAAAFGLADLAIRGFIAGWEITIGLYKEGIRLVDEFKTSQAAMAAAIAGTDFEGSFERAYDLAGDLLQRVEKLDSQFVGTGEELRILTDAMLTFGMGIDLSTEAQEKQFVGFANLIKLMTRGQNFQRQALQEVRSLMEGVAKPGAVILTKLQAAGVEVKKMVPLWREQGVLLEKINEILPGYLQAGESIENTLTAQKGTLETITNKILREAMAPAYDDIVQLVKNINDYLYDENGLTAEAQILVEALKTSWEGVVAAAKTVKTLIEASLYPLKLLTEQAVAYGEALDRGGMTGITDMGLDLVGDPGAWEEAGRENAKAYLRGIEGYTSEVDVLEMFYGSDLDLELKVDPAKGKKDVDAAAKAFEGYQKRLQEFLVKQQEDLAIESLRASSKLEAALLESKTKIDRAFRKFTESEHYAKLSKSQKDAIQQAYDELVDIKSEAVIEAWEKKQTDAVSKAWAEVDKFWKKGAAAFDTGETVSKLGLELAKIDDEAQSKIDKISETLKAAGTLEYDPDFMDPIIEAILKARDKMKALAEQKYTREMERETRAFAAGIQALREEAETPVAWPWSDDDVERLALLADATRKYAGEIEKLNERFAKGQTGELPEMSTEEYQKYYDAIRDAWFMTQEKIIEATDRTNELIAESYVTLIEGLRNEFSNVFMDGFSGDLKNIEDYFDAFTDVVRKMWANLLADMLTDWFENQAKMQIQEGLGAAIGGIGGFFSGIFGGGGGSPTALQLSGPFAEGGILPGAWSPVKAFQHGGIVDKPTLGVIGEGGGPEAVIPLRGGKVPVELSGMHPRQDVNVNFSIVAADTKDFDRLIYERKNMIVGMMQKSVREAQPSRDIIRRYGR
jgi:hypothetical protein